MPFRPLLFLFAGCFALAQESPSKKEVEEREARAQALYDEGKSLMQGGKFREAQGRLRELRDRYRITTVCLTNYSDIIDRLAECGSRIAVSELRNQALYRRTHQDSMHGIEFAPPDGWRGIPPQPGHAGETDTSEVNYAGQFVRITRYTSRFLETLFLQAYKLYAAKDLGQVESKAIEYLGERYRGLAVDSTAPFRGQAHPGTRKLCRDSEGNRVVIYSFHADRKGFALVGFWRTQAESDFLSFSSSKKREIREEDWKEALRVFDLAARGFTIWTQDVLAHKRIQLSRGTQVSDWKTLRTRNYVIEYATRDDFAKKVGDQMERIMALYKATLPTSKVVPPCRIRLFDTEEDFQYYGQVPGAAAYWSPSQEEICAYRFNGRELKLDSKESMTVVEGRDPEEETFHVMFHEGFHQYMHFYMGRSRNIYVPSWINEGLGDYFFGGTWSKKGGKLSLEIQPNWWRLETIQKAIRENRHIPLPRIFRFTQSQYYSDPGLCYAEGWAICYFFLTSDVAKKRGYAKHIEKLLYQLLVTENWEKATDLAFTGADLAKMEEEWKDYILSLKP